MNVGTGLPQSKSSDKIRFRQVNAYPYRKATILYLQVQSKVNQLRTQESRLSGVFCDWQKEAKVKMEEAQRLIAQAEKQLER